MDTRTSQHVERRSTRGFTVLELLVVAAIIVGLIAFLGVALNGAIEGARRTSSQQAVRALAASVEQFETEFGFLPPLVHDGPIMSAGDADYVPRRRDGSSEEGPVFVESEPGGSYVFGRVVVWDTGSRIENLDFLRRRDGTPGGDEVELSSGGAWSLDSAWDDRRYSRFALAYYLAGVLPRSVDGVSGQGMARPQRDGGFVGVGYPVGTARDRYESLIDTDRGGLSIQTGYARPVEALEHGAATADPEEVTVRDVYDLYADAQLDDLAAVVDGFGTAFRYYRWEHGRLNSEGRLVVESTLDLNIPPVLIDPEVLVQLENDDGNALEYDLTGGNPELRAARFAIVGAGPDGLFGTEPVDYLVFVLNAKDPEGDPERVAQLRKRAMDDNVVALGD